MAKTKTKKDLLNQKRIGVGFLVVTIVLLPVVVNVWTTYRLDYRLEGSVPIVLGDEDEGNEDEVQEVEDEEEERQEEQEQEEQKEQEESRREEQGGRPEPTKVKTKTETVDVSGTKVKTESEGLKRETEIETADGQKIKTKLEDDGTAKIEVENGSLKLKYTTVNGRTEVRAEDEFGQEVELEEEDLAELQEDVQVTSVGGSVVVVKNRVATVSELPISIDVETKQLIVSTPNGERVVTILPDQAIRHLLATGVVNSVDDKAEGEQTSLDGVVNLETKNEQVVYKIKGIKKYQMFGLIPVATPVTAYVSVDTGESVAKEQSVLASIVDLLSP